MFARSERLKELFRVEITKTLTSVKDPGLSGFLTVTDVDLSADGKTVNVFYSLLGSGAQRESTQKALERASPYIRQVLRKRLTLKMIPAIVFHYDDTPQRASRVDKLLLQLEQEDRPEDP
ncbi:MAG: 30S ribosome-binding factor RbfA [Elusimicrobia bacterium]|nr:30S ribosome-binding factor RbfA [Elusimicrobiota bacterium]